MFEIPEDNLPPGFAQRLEEPTDPVEPVPAATVVLLRDGADGPEVLLMRRQRTSGFVPGAWVFPGGRVDPADADDGLLERCRGLDPKPVPERPFWMAALREAFEETGVLLARDADGRWLADATTDPEVEAVRRSLMADEATLVEVVERLDVELDARALVHAAHWVTPVAEPRRYDTHFFAAAIPEARAARPDPREMVEAAWLTAGSALERFRAGTLPMVFPTVRTLDALAEYPSAGAALDGLRDRPVQRILPRLVRTPNGVGIVIDD